MKAIKLTTCGSSMPHYNQIIGGAAQIMVNEKDYEKATEIMNFIC